jgi:beta-lactamase class A
LFQVVKYSKRTKTFGILAAVISVVIASTAVFLAGRDKPVDNVLNVSSQPVVQEPQLDSTAPTGAPISYVSTFDATALQSAVDSWFTTAGGGSASVVIVDPKDGSVLASLNPDAQYFTASLYKLYVAYEGYKQVDVAAVDPSESYQEGRSRAECLDLMIRESDSPCGEKMWAEIGKQNLTQILKGYGLQNTDMTALRTTAADTARMLRRISTSEGLSEASQTAYLDSMKTQQTLYRRGLPSGFSSEVVVYNKVGWNEQQEYHDAAIVELPDGRRVVIAMLTSGVGTRNISGLAQALEPILTK